MSAITYVPTITPPPSGRPASTRTELLAAILDPNRLPTPPAVAVQVVNAASKPDCDPQEIITLLSLDPALCAKLLRAVNSCIYGLKQPVASVARAVQVLGLKTVRSLALGLSLPAVKNPRANEAELREFWISSVGGAIIARELALLSRRPAPDDDLVAGLLRDMGEVLLQQAFPERWAEHTQQKSHQILENPCAAEITSFGIDHAEVSAELLRSWKLPDDIVEPIRFHHQPGAMVMAFPHRRERAELLAFASRLVQLDAVVQRPELLEQLLRTARERFQLSQAALIEFLQRIAPKVEAFANVLNQDIGQCPDFAAILAVGAAELVNLTVETSRTRLSGTIRPAPLRTARPDSAQTSVMTAGYAPGGELPEFGPLFFENFPAGGCLLGEYHLLSILGRGAMGYVFKAWEPSLDRYVAIKMLAPELAAMPAAQQRFAREARVAAAIQNEHVVRIYAVREFAGMAYLAMEYINGSCLESQIQQHGPLPIPLVLDIARQVAKGLAAAHAKNIIHRDIKPANILIEHDSGRVKITDFGLARVSDDAKMTADGSLVGTPFYMAPEIIQGEEATPLSDLFSLGAVLYMMATGRLPFPGQTCAAVYHAVCSLQPVAPRQVRPHIPEWLEAVILRLLTKNPTDRYPHANAVVAALSEY